MNCVPVMTLNVSSSSSIQCIVSSSSSIQCIVRVYSV